MSKHNEDIQTRISARNWNSCKIRHKAVTHIPKKLGNYAHSHLTNTAAATRGTVQKWEKITEELQKALLYTYPNDENQTTIPTWAEEETRKWSNEDEWKQMGEMAENRRTYKEQIQEQASKIKKLTQQIQLQKYGRRGN